MISNTLQDTINDQIKHELNSAYLYLSMSAYCQAVSLPGFAHWMRLQYGEEVEHAMKLFDYLADREGRVTLQALEQPLADFKSALEMMQYTLGHERKVTGLINQLYDVAVKENDRAAQVFLEWFITEQVEEEKNASTIVEKMKMVGSEGATLYLLDREMGARGSGG
ncbi:MAG: ferritin [Chloroflexi bacterium]|nr:ferritin [Chloroflexota bacterium]